MICTAHPLCRTTHPYQKASVPPAVCTPTASPQPDMALGSGGSPQEPSSYFCSPGRALAVRLLVAEAATHPVPRWPARGAERELPWVKKAASILLVRQGRAPKSPASPHCQEPPRALCLWGAIRCICQCKTQWVPNQGHPSGYQTTGILSPEPSPDPYTEERVFLQHRGTDKATSRPGHTHVPAATPAPTQNPPSGTAAQGFG